MVGMSAISVVVCLVNTESIFHAVAKSEPEPRATEEEERNNVESTMGMGNIAHTHHKRLYSPICAEWSGV